MKNCYIYYFEIIQHVDIVRGVLLKRVFKSDVYKMVKYSVSGLLPYLRVPKNSSASAGTLDSGTFDVNFRFRNIWQRKIVFSEN